MSLRTDYSKGEVLQAEDINNINNTINSLEKNKQDILTSGTTIKTLNYLSLLGEGNIDISVEGVTVDETFNPESPNAQSGKGIADYLVDQISGKQDVLKSEANIKTINGISILGSGDIDFTKNWIVDKEYSPNSVNAQSGTAVAEAIAGIISPDEKYFEFYLDDTDTSPGYYIKGFKEIPWRWECVIPDSYKGIPVVGIYSDIFSEANKNKCQKIISIKFGNCIKSLEDISLQYCENLRNIYIPISIEKIDREFFSHLDAIHHLNVYYQGSIQQWHNISEMNAEELAKTEKITMIYNYDNTAATIGDFNNKFLFFSDDEFETLTSGEINGIKEGTILFIYDDIYSG